MNLGRFRRKPFAVLSMACVLPGLVLWILFRPIKDGPLVCGGCSPLWIDTVKQGDMLVEAIGYGSISLANGRTAARAVINVPDSQSREIKLNQFAEIDIRPGTVPAHVTQIGPTAVNGNRSVQFTLDAAVPDGVADGALVDATIDMATLHDVVYIKRPVHGEPNSVFAIFRVTADGDSANRVLVKSGGAGANAMQILSGLKPGDKVILSDMSNWDAVDHVVLK